MANNKMLIDAAHPEETRVALVRGNRVEEFDFESEHKKQIRGNIYLAKVTRVEPSLQAAFVDYGGNRHGFLAFSEIHPDYYQIPMADRQALIEEEAADARAEKEAQEADDDDDAASGNKRPRRARRRSNKADDNVSEGHDDAQGDDAQGDDDAADLTDEESDDNEEEQSAENDGDDVVSESAEEAKPKRRTARPSRKKAEPAEAEAETAKDDTAAETDASAEPNEAEKPKRKRATRSRKKKSDESPESESDSTDSKASQTEDGKSEQAGDTADTSEEKPKRRRASRRKKATADEPTAEAADPANENGAKADGSVSDAEASDADKSGDAEDGDGSGNGSGNGRRSRRSRGGSRRGRNRKTRSDDSDDNDDDGDDGDANVEEVGSDDALEEVPVRRSNRRNYKIQEVIKRRQILLVQVVKEERGNKGAALTTYLSLAGRYSVLMPNTARGGGISRKITNSSDRKRLKAIASDLDVPQGMGVILRTAGASRTQAEVQRDFEYLMRLWENVRTLTLESTAPCLVYEEGSLIKRSIRDLYDKDTSEIIVAGEAGYQEAHDFMGMLMPGHEKSIKAYRDRVPMFAKLGVEAQLDAMLQPQVTLKSGGYLVINQTEALVAIDVNSGRATRQHSVEETALQTNLEAADEVARQLRLRDLAGLIVIDFIDMDERRNNRSVEKRLKDALKNDRARIQVGRISHFGLMEMSRQRMRASVLESTTQTCPTCEGTGHVRSPSSVVLGVLRMIEEQLNRNSKFNLIVRVRAETALYLLNSKRENIGELEERFGVDISIDIDPGVGSEHCVIDRGDQAVRRPQAESAVQVDTFAPQSEDADTSNAASEEAHDSQVSTAPRDNADARADDEKPADGRRKRRRRRKSTSENAEEPVENEAGSGEEASDEEADPASNEGRKPRTRRSRKGKKAQESDDSNQDADASEDAGDSAATKNEKADTESPSPDEPGEKPKKPRARRLKSSDSNAEESAAENAPPSDKKEPAAETESARAQRRRVSRPGKIAPAAKKEPAETPPEAEAEEEITAPTSSATEPPRKPRRRTSRPEKVAAASAEVPARDHVTEPAAEQPAEPADEAPRPKKPRKPRQKKAESEATEKKEAEVDQPVTEASAEADASADTGNSGDGDDGKKDSWFKRKFF